MRLLQLICISVGALVTLSPAVLRGESILVDFGCFAPNAAVAKKVGFKHVDAVDFEVSGITVSCGCVAVKEHPRALSATQMNEVLFEVKRLEKGPFRQEVVISSRSNEGKDRKYRFEIVGVVQGAWSSEAELSLPTGSRRELRVFIAGDENASEPNIAADGFPVEISLVSKSEKLHGSVKIREFVYVVERNMRIAELLSGEVEFRFANNTHASVNLKLPPSAETSCRPESLFFGTVRPGGISRRRVTIASTDSIESLSAVSLASTSKCFEFTKIEGRDGVATFDIVYISPTNATTGVEKGTVEWRLKGELLGRINYLAVNSK